MSFEFNEEDLRSIFPHFLLDLSPKSLDGYFDLTPKVNSPTLNINGVDFEAAHSFYHHGCFTCNPSDVCICDEFI